MKKALLVLSFGTSYQEILEKNILPVEEALKKAFSDYDFYRGFTSRFIVKKLNRQGVEVKIEKDMLEYLLEEGYEDILVQPTHMIPGFEYEEKILTLETLSPKVKVGKPLLFEQADYKKLGDVLNQFYALDTLSVPFVFMGHGTDHVANQHYIALGHYLNEQYPNVYLAGVEGECSFDDVLENLIEKQVKKVSMAPLMIVAGDHAKNDMAGSSESSWKSLAEKAGLEVEVHMQGLGALKGVHQLIIDKMNQV